MPISHGALDIHCDELGHGEPVIMLHSSGMSGRQWRRLADALAPSHRVLMPNLLGYPGTRGWSPSDDFALEDDLELVRAVVRAQSRPVHLVGHSYGGFLALAAARTLPKGLVTSLSLYEPVAWGVVLAEHADKVRAQLANFGDTFFSDSFGGSADWYQIFIDFWSGPGAWNALPEAQRAAFLAVGRKVFLEVRALCFEPTPAAAYRDQDVPTLLLSGQSTPLIERLVCETLAATLPNATHVTFPGIGHMGILVAPDLVCPTIVEHIRHASPTR